MTEQVTEQPTLLALLLERKGLHRFGSFGAAYEKAARSLDRQLSGTAPSRAQFSRWTKGELRGLPYTDHCRVLEHMLPGYSAAQLFTRCPDGKIPTISPGPDQKAARTALPTAGQTADVVAVYASRSQFADAADPLAMIQGARRIRAAGLSLNLICQQLPDQQLIRQLTDGTQLTCLFLDPDGEAIKAREQEEEYHPGFLADLTRLNIQLMTRLRDRLPEEAQARLHLAVYDETIRFNILLFDTDTAVVQPYMPQARGIDSPTLLIRRSSAPGGLYPVFEQVYDALAERSKPV
jgi:hypothetical protein